MTTDTSPESAGRPGPHGRRAAGGPLDGVLFFPVTAFDKAGRLAPEVLAEHIAAGVAAGPGAVFAACGTGEIHALSESEHAEVVRTAVDATDGKVPVYAGVGGSVATAMAMARESERAGADGLLLLPPYLVNVSQRGLVRYVEAVSTATALPIIVYNRGNSIYQPDTAAALAQMPSVAGIKDGYGDLGLMSQLVSAVRSVGRPADRPFQFFNGMPTAELTMPAYWAIGVRLYSSAVFCFAPEIALSFRRGLEAADTAALETLMEHFFLPFVKLREQEPGFAVSLVKAAVRLRGLDVGGVRAPLVDPDRGHIMQLQHIVAEGMAAADGLPR